MKKNTMSILFISFLISSFFSCSTPSQNAVGAETTTENVVIPTEEISTETAKNPAFEELLNEFTECDNSYLAEFLKNDESCAETSSFTDEEGKTKMEAIAAQILALTPKGATINVFDRQSPLEDYVVYEEATSYSLNSLTTTNWENLVFLSFNVMRVSMPMYQSYSTVLVFTKSGEFKSAFINHFEYDQLSSKTCNQVEKMPTSLKLSIVDIEKSEDGDKIETGISSYLIDKTGTVTYTETQK